MATQISTIQLLGTHPLSIWFQSILLLRKGALLDIIVIYLLIIVNICGVHCCCALRFQTVMVQKAQGKLQKIVEQNGRTHITSGMECRGPHFRNGI